MSRTHKHLTFRAPGGTVVIETLGSVELYLTAGDDVFLSCPSPSACTVHDNPKKPGRRHMVEDAETYLVGQHISVSTVRMP